jgi:ADYC domain-containing protein
MARRVGVRAATIAAVVVVVLGAVALVSLRDDDPTQPELLTGSLSADGTEFILTSTSGRKIRSADLVGKTVMMDIGSGDALVTIRDVELDRRAVNGEVLLHRLVFFGKSGKAADVCDRDPDGRRLAFPVPDGNGGYDLTCTSGAIGKCVRWGYRPWEQKADGPPLRDLHKACVLMTRADYGGDGTTSTRDGTRIYLCDRFGVVPCSVGGGPLAFEAAWGPDRAVCVARPRIPEKISLDQIAARYPDLAPRLGPESCTQDSALRDPEVLLIDRS